MQAGSICKKCSASSKDGHLQISWPTKTPNLLKGIDAAPYISPSGAYSNFERASSGYNASPASAEAYPHNANHLESMDWEGMDLPSIAKPGTDLSIGICPVYLSSRPVKPPLRGS